MPNYFYRDASGQKQGPINDAQLQAMAASGVITANTQLETDSGLRGLAGQVHGLKFNSSPPPSVPTVTDQSRNR